MRNVFLLISDAQKIVDYCEDMESDSMQRVNVEQSHV